MLLHFFSIRCHAFRGNYGIKIIFWFHNLWVMKITQFWDRFYHLESVPHIKYQKIWCQVSGVRCQDMGNTNWRYLTPDT